MLGGRRKSAGGTSGVARMARCGAESEARGIGGRGGEYGGRWRNELVAGSRKTREVMTRKDNRGGW